MSVGYNVRTSILSNNGNTLYVGGTGGSNYTKIQDAINETSDGDTVFVYDDSSPYYENLIVEKSINLIGENRDTTVIDADVYNLNVVLVSADKVRINGFTILNGGGIDILSRCNTISGNIISSSISNGIKINKVSGNNIIDNIISLNDREGIYITGGRTDVIEGNTITDNGEAGINLFASYNGFIYRNTISSNKGNGIELRHDSGGYFIEENNIANNGKKGIRLYAFCDKNAIYHNNFIDNYESAFDYFNNGTNLWDDGKYGNYWSDYKEKYPFATRNLLKPWMWNTPYEIDGGSNKDMCPLVEQWPHSKTRTIQKDIALYSFYLLRLLEQFPILHRLLSLLRVNL